jgi:group II intron reverse transcriptase/maturase
MDPANLSTKLQWIAELARRKRGEPLFLLHHLIDLEWMQEAYDLTRKDGASGIDGVTADEYEVNLEANLLDLLERIKSGRYHAPPVRRTYIPKADGSQRPLGIPTFEDKVAQRAIVMVLEAIYEQDFCACSHAFRPARSAHDALHELYVVTTWKGQHWVLEVDIRKYFDSIPHSHLRALLDQRVTDGIIRRMIDKWLKAGVWENGLLRRATEGTPQGGVISPILSNIFLHHVLDEWFETEVRPRLTGNCTLVRYADDFVMTFKSYRDAQRVLEVLGKRLGRFGLALHPDKTRLIDFRPEKRDGTHPDCHAPPFDFLGFTHTWVKSKKGRNVVRQTTAKSRLARSLVRINDWCRRNRHWPLRSQHDALSAKLEGHYAYFGITGNHRQLGRYFQQVARIWRKWLARRTRSKALPWDRFNALLQRLPLPRPRSCVTHAGLQRSSAMRNRMR